MSAPTILGVELREIAPWTYEAQTPLGRTKLQMVRQPRGLDRWRVSLFVVAMAEWVCFPWHLDRDEAVRLAEKGLSALLAIGRAQGLREAAGICDTVESGLGVALGAPSWVCEGHASMATMLDDARREITAAAERAEAG